MEYGAEKEIHREEIEESVTARTGTVSNREGELTRLRKGDVLRRTNTSAISIELTELLQFFSLIAVDGGADGEYSTDFDSEGSRKRSRARRALRCVRN